MITRTVKLNLLYVGESSLRWARTAATVVDRSIAGLCARQWRCVEVARVEAPRRLPRGRQLHRAVTTTR